MPRLGQKRNFPTPEDLRKAFQKYFDETPDEELTLTGLAFVFGSNQALSDYLNKEVYKDYRPIIREAKMLIELSYSKSLRKYSRVGDIFALKNMGWKDRQELTGKNGRPIPFQFVDYKPIKDKKDKKDQKTTPQDSL